MTSSDERFHELAHKTLSKEAVPAEQAELQALIADKPELKQAFDQMGMEASVVKEILPLLQDIQHTQPSVPPPPMRRLQSEIESVFESPGELHALLMRLERWAARQIGIEYERALESISFLRRSLSASGGEQVGPTRPLAQLRLADDSMLKDKQAEFPVIREAEEEEARKQQAEFERRLRSLVARLQQAERITHECQDEVRILIEAFSRVRFARATQERARSNRPEKTGD